jgi:hypothetical protein
MSENDRAELEKKIAKYRALARWVPDHETARRINELVSELEQQLHASRGPVGLSAWPVARNKPQLICSLVWFAFSIRLRRVPRAPPPYPSDTKKPPEGGLSVALSRL